MSAGYPVLVSSDSLRVEHGVPSEPGQVIASMRLAVARLRFQLSAAADLAVVSSWSAPLPAPFARPVRPAWTTP